MYSNATRKRALTLLASGATLAEVSGELSVSPSALRRWRGPPGSMAAWALDLVDVAWRQSNWKTISVSRRTAVARLDALIGPKA